ncbi:hypothetical protein [uncultured Corynebacterium sp.]|uniref:hypothetical protein n=1 Tax=uncultured Corynebacterium sp. TaxID=159447 RepID=UPI0025F44E16|nr:hypothetical protein [uncultured Corynebacterium sp.]
MNSAPDTCKTVRKCQRVAEPVYHAIEYDYRHIDTAQAYSPTAHGAAAVARR